MTARAAHIATLVAVVAAAAVIGIAYGLPYGANNQQTYLLDSLVRTFPDLYRHDWFVSEMHHYHVAFAYVTSTLFALDHDGAIMFGIAQLVTMIATLVMVYAIVRTVVDKRTLLVYLGVVGIVALGAGRSFGGSYLIAGYLQPSSFAVLAWLVALWAWVQNRSVLTGIALGIGAVFHLNYALLGVGVFAACELCTHTTLRRMAIVIGPSLVVLAVFVPTMLASSHTDEPALALDILVRFAFPIHFKPARMVNDLPMLVGWVVIAWTLRPLARDGARDRLWWFAVIGLGLCLAAFCIAAIPPLRTVTRLFVWRIAPLPQLAALVLVFDSLRAVAAGEAKLARWRLALLVGGAVLVIANAYLRPRGVYAEVATVVVVVFAAAVIARRAVVIAALGPSLFVVALWWSRATLVAPILFDSFDTDVTKWAREHTPVDAVFLAPPYYNTFRLEARRAIVVDTKSPPMYLDELVEWYRRLCTIADARELRVPGDADLAWDALPPERLIAIAHHFHADYIVLAKPRSSARLAVPIAYEDDGNVVYATPP